MGCGGLDINDSAQRYTLTSLPGEFFGLDLFKDVAGASTLFKVDSQEWFVAKSAICIRNHITHPGSSNDLNISGSDLNHLKTVEKVILELFASSMEGAGDALWKSDQTIKGVALNRSIPPTLNSTSSIHCSEDS